MPLSNITIHVIVHKHYGELGVQLGPGTTPQLFAVVCHTAKPEAQLIYVGCKVVKCRPLSTDINLHPHPIPIPKHQP